MTPEGAQVQPGGAEIPFRPRGTYAGHRAFGSGDGAVLVEPGLARQLRSAAELATQERRCAGGLVFGRRWVDDRGGYLVVSGFVEAGPDASSGERGAGDDFTLSVAELGLLREDAAAIYPASYEVGWWRTLAALGEFGAGDLATQAQLAAADGVGLLVYGSGIHWGTAYLGPDGRAPDSAGTLVVAPGLDDEPPAGPAPALEPDQVADPRAVPEPGPEVVDIAAGESLLTDEPLLSADFIPPQDAAAETAAPGRARRRVRPATGRARRPVRPTAGQARQRMSSRVRVPTRARARAGRPVDAGYPDGGYPGAGDQGEAFPGPELPADARLVLIALALAAVAVAVIVGLLVHNVIVALIIAAVGLLAIFVHVWTSRIH